MACLICARIVPLLAVNATGASGGLVTGRSLLQPIVPNARFWPDAVFPARKGCFAVSAPENLAPHPEAFLQDLIDAYWRPLVAYASRFLDSRDDAEDAV